MSQPKSLLLYDDDYVLMHKRTLLINTAVISAMAEFIATDKNTSSDSVAATFGIGAVELFGQMTNEQISDRANSVVGSCWQANQTKFVITTDLTTELTPPDESA